MKHRARAATSSNRRAAARAGHARSSPGSKDAPTRAIARWREALRHEEAIDLYGQASETRVRLARALARRGEIAKRRRALLAPCSSAPTPKVAPGGALFAVDALGELAAVDWGGAWRRAQRERCAPGSQLLRPSARSVPCCHGHRRAEARRTSACRPRARRAAPDRRRRQQQADRTRVRPEPAHRQAPRREHPRQAGCGHPRPGGRLVPRATLS